MKNNEMYEEFRKFNKDIKTRKSFLSGRTTIDITTLAKREATILEFFDKGVLISPKLVNKDNILDYKKALETVKQFPMQFRPDNIYADRILGKTSKGRNTRRILVDSVREQDQGIMDDYDKMVAHYLLMGGDKPIERFSKVEMSMKQYGLKPNIGISIMKYGDSLTSKLEELAQEGRKSSQEWDAFKNQVLHSFIVAENIGNRNVNEQEHQIWEERLIRLGILERKLEKPANQEKTLRESVKINGNKRGKPSDPSKQGVLLDETMRQRAERKYIDTGAIPLGYTLVNGKVVSIASKIRLTSSEDRLSASENNLSATGKNSKQAGKQSIR